MMILPEGSAHGLVVHVGLVLVEPPQPGHRLAVHQLEDALLPVGPLDEPWTTLFVLKVCTLYKQCPKISNRNKNLSNIPEAV